jgi:hypothetical protein
MRNKKRGIKAYLISAGEIVPGKLEFISFDDEPTASAEESPFEKLKTLTRKPVSVPKAEVAEKKKQTKRKKDR